MPEICHLVGGWATPLKNINVNWDDEQPNINGKMPKIDGNQTTNQPRQQNSPFDGPIKTFGFLQ